MNSIRTTSKPIDTQRLVLSSETKPWHFPDGGKERDDPVQKKHSCYYERCTFYWLRGCYLGAIIGALLFMRCTHTTTQMSQPRINRIEQLRSLVTEQSKRLDSYTAEIRLTYFGTEGRIRSTASLAIKKPASLRYDVVGPHGATLEVFSTNGSQIFLIDLRKSKYYYGDATPANMDRLMAIAPLQLEPKSWVELLLGIINPPPYAKLRITADKQYTIAFWHQGAVHKEVYFQSDDFRVCQAIIYEQGVIKARVEVKKWDQELLPILLYFELREPKQEIEIKLRDIDKNPQLPPDTFHLAAPANMQIFHLSDNTSQPLLTEP